MSKGLFVPEGYESHLNLLKTEIAIKQIKDFFQKELAAELNLTRVSAPLYVTPESGLNDDLNGVERPVQFDIKEMGSDVQIVHSLAKWKRMALYRYGIGHYEGIYTDMNAIRRDEDLDNIHSVYVDQWDWEKKIPKEERTEEKLIQVVKRIYRCFKDSERYLFSLYPALGELLPEEITFITTQELADKYPGKTAKEREASIAKEHKAVFIMKIGGKLESGEKHDGRAPDYDDWELNGDIIFWNPILDDAFEISSMGIRVDEIALEKQLKEAGCEDRLCKPFHKMLIEGKLPYTIGGGIGQSRMCMFFLRKAHIGEVQASVWPADMVRECEKNGIFLL